MKKSLVINFKYLIGCIILLPVVVFGIINLKNDFSNAENISNEKLPVEIDDTIITGDKIIDSSQLVNNYKKFTSYEIVNNQLRVIFIREKFLVEVVEYVFLEIEDREEEIYFYFKQHSHLKYSIKIEYINLEQIITLGFIENTTTT